MNISSQCDQILDQLERGEPITPIDALRKYGCFRLAARINDLRRRGHEIRTVIVDDGESRFAKYFLDSRA